MELGGVSFFFLFFSILPFSAFCFSSWVVFPLFRVHYVFSPLSVGFISLLSGSRSCS